MLDPTEFGKAMAAIVKEAIAPIQRELDELKSRAPEKDQDGKSMTVDDVAPLIAAQIKDAMDAMPKPNVIDELVKTDALKPVLDLLTAEAVAEYVNAHPLRDGVDGKSVTDEQVASHVRNYLQSNPPESGKDGVGIAGALIDRDGALVVTLTNGETRSLGLVVGHDGKDGKSMCDVTREYDADAHEVVERWVVDGEARSLRYPAGGIRPGGFWRDGMKSLASQAVTHAGALWIAKRDNTVKPCAENADDWQLAARAGRDGSNGRNGIDRTKPVKLKDDNDNA